VAACAVDVVEVVLSGRQQRLQGAGVAAQIDAPDSDGVRRNGADDYEALQLLEKGGGVPGRA
jgi:hypothetical protein